MSLGVGQWDGRRGRNVIAHSTTGTNTDAAGEPPPDQAPDQAQSKAQDRSAAVARRSVPLGSPAATAALARRLAAAARPGDVFALSGKLGAGKTHFARHFIGARAGDTAVEVPSPTFTLVQTYELPGATVWHFDLYRIASPDELDELGWDDARTGGIVLVEWPERAGARLAADRLDIELGFAADADARVAVLAAHGNWAARLKELGV